MLKEETKLQEQKGKRYKFENNKWVEMSEEELSLLGDSNPMWVTPDFKEEVIAKFVNGEWFFELHKEKITEE